MQKLFLTGRLGRDAEVKEVNGSKFATFSVATNGRKKDGVVPTTWFNVTWRNYSTNMLQYLKKGTSVAVIGEQEVGIWVNNQNQPQLDLRVAAASVDFLSDGTRSEQQGEQQQLQQSEPTSKAQTMPKIETKPKYSPSKPMAAQPIEEEQVQTYSASVLDEDDNQLPF